jgi:hypothetical protein
MKFPRILSMLLLALVCTPLLPAQEAGLWSATSSNAKAITGEIGVSTSKLTINFINFPIAQIRSLTTDEMLAAFNPDNPAGAVGHLYKLDIPASRIMLHKNTLCGGEGAQWMATAIDGRSLRLAFFSSQAPPVFTIDALQNSSDLCGIYTYGR